MKKNWFKFKRVDLFAALLGVLTIFSFAPFYLFPLAVIAPAGLLLLIQKSNAKQAAFRGFMFGLGMFGAGVYWIFISIHQYGDVIPLLAGLITAALIAILALFPATACYATNRYFPINTTKRMVLAFPAMWLISEWVRSWVVCGFTWLFLGYSQTNSPLRGFAPLLSVYGVSLAVLFSSGLVASAILEYREKAFTKLYMRLLSLSAIWILGTMLAFIPWTEKLGKPVTVSLVQGNIPQSIKWSSDFLNLSLERYAELSEPYWGKSQIIIWPEAAIPSTLNDVNTYVDQMYAKAVNSNTDLVMGIPVERSKAKGGGYYNAVIALGKNLDPRESYYLKRRLVPYGEYVPFEWLSARVLDFMNVPMSNMYAGEYNQEPMTIANVRVNTSICFEITFPELIFTNDRNIGMLLTVTNDAWFGKSIAQAQHLQMAMMRAIELGRPVLFASNDGITAIINSFGQIEAKAPAHVPYVLTGKVQPMVGMTPWMTNSMDPLLVIIFILILLARLDQKKKATETNYAIPNSISK